MFGYELLETIGSFAVEAPVAAILRHAARYPILDVARPELAEITPAGAKAAEEMGRRLSGFDCLRLFHSPVKRCQQTAECLARGAGDAGLKITHLGPEDALGVDYILDLAEAGKLSQLHGEDFVRLWIRGEVSPQIIRETKHIAETKMTYLTRRLSEPTSQGRRLDLHVSHDWNIMVLREHLLGVRHEEAGWLSFLDGIGFCLQDGVLRAKYRQEESRQTLPWAF
ncbi:MAG: histidine phosphatase family protein [Nibricoccus sp.]